MKVTQIIRERVPLYERSSIDEFYIDLSGMDKFFGCYRHATELRQTIIKETGLPISFGMSANKTVSKVATDEAKPNNQMKIDYGEEKTFPGAAVGEEDSHGRRKNLSPPAQHGRGKGENAAGHAHGTAAERAG
jgi:hypothetical protein